MEYLPGFQLCDILKHFDQLKNEDVKVNETFLMHLLIELSEALYYIHKKKIIHRDISTNNVMVIVKKDPFDIPRKSIIRSDNTDSPVQTPKTPTLNFTIQTLTSLPSSKIQFKLLDFGFVTRKLTENSLIDSFDKGTPDFLSPEFLVRKPYNEKVDIFSLAGVILNFMMSKQCHVYATLITEGRGKLFQKLLKKGYSDFFLTIIFKMLEISPDKRISSQELYDAIQPLKKEIISREIITTRIKTQELKRRESLRVENMRCLKIMESSSIVSVTKQFNLNFWDWKKKESLLCIPSAHIWSISDIISLSPGTYFDSLKSEKILLVSGGPKIKLLKIDCCKKFPRKSNKKSKNKKLREEEEEEDGEDGEDVEHEEKQEKNENEEEQKCYTFSKSFYSSEQVEVICPLADSGNTHLFASGGHKVIEIWDIRSTNAKNSKNIKSDVILRGHEDAVVSLCSFSSGRMLCSGSKDRTARIWDLERACCLCTRKNSKFVSCVNYNDILGVFSYSNSWGMEVRFFDYRMSNSHSHSSKLDYLMGLDVGAMAMTQHITSYEIFNGYYLVVGDNLRLSAYDLRYMKNEEYQNVENRGVVKLWGDKQSCNDIMDLPADTELFASCDREGTIRVKHISTGKTEVVIENEIGSMMEWKTLICCL